QFVTVPQPKPFYFMSCIPVDPTQGGPFLNTLFPNYDDLRTDETGPCPTCGIFTQTLGTAPNRQFVIRWKTTYFNISGSTAEFEVLLTEGSNTLSAIYGTTANNGVTGASGIQLSDDSKLHPAMSDSLQVVLLYGSGTDSSPACELYTHKLWQSHDDPDSHGYSNGYSHGDGNSDSNAYLNANANADSYSYFN